MTLSGQAGAWNASLVACPSIPGKSVALTDELPHELASLLSASEDASEERAWHGFLEAHSRLILHTLHRLGGDHDTVMDRYAYVIEQLRRDRHHRLRGYSPSQRSKFTTWLVVVVHRLGLDHHRRRYGSPNDTDGNHDSRAERRRLVDLLAEHVDVETLASADAGAPDSEIRSADLHRVLTTALGHLDPRDRLLLRLRFELDLPARRVADLMGLPTPFHVYRRCNRLCGALRDDLARSGVQDRDP
ncbi:MAG: sigma-70 family RNA polymerase sigma factor [Gemmatimonadota bacterium]